MNDDIRLAGQKSALSNVVGEAEKTQKTKTTKKNNYRLHETEMYQFCIGMTHHSLLALLTGGVLNIWLCGPLHDVW